MSNFIQGRELRTLNLGRGVVSSASGAFAADTRTIFTVTGGEVMITALWGKVTTTITVANTVKLQANPTTGNTADLVTATDLGTTDTAAGTVIGLDQGTTAPSKLLANGRVDLNAVVSTGDVEQVVTGTGPDGDITWYCTWIPLSDGADLVAA